MRAVIVKIAIAAFYIHYLIETLPEGTFYLKGQFSSFLLVIS